MSSPGTITLLFLVFVALRLSRFWDAKTQVPDPMPGMQVPLNASNSFTDVMTRTTLVMAAAGLCAGLGFLLIAHDVNMMIGVSIMSLGLPPLTAWNFRLAHSGYVELRSDALIIHVRNATHEYPWYDIEAVRVSSWNDSGPIERGMVRVVGANAHEPFVRLRLRRSIAMTMGLWRTRYGTEVAGLPLPMREIKIFVQNPETFVELARPYLIPATSAVAGLRSIA